MNDQSYGHIEIRLNEIIKRKGLSKNKVMQRAELQSAQLKSYGNGDIQRLDMAILSRLCYVLDCSIADLLEYIPPEKK
ncbi:helix-turn-helix domain-containing protein [Zongyangia hominis]|uniref:Helix-turn-helix transcriptional regulator n=1 Tax=Zongyangia hominis TaxID=2763677 RepID=A0A926EDU3_9FIRM|nr:helix-turn-helix transcriptional regulator [Zongyangia hominis]MBC8570086.1 helix-turn-helix transcriptional regulator [Zongyangia hominis]